MRVAAFMAGLGLAVLSHSPAQAGGIDCSTAKGPYSKAICSDPALHQQDQDLGTAYANLAKDASPAGRSLLQRDEQDRRAFIEEACAPSDKTCLSATHTQALDSLAKFAAAPAGLLPVEHFRLDADKTRLLTATPRIDHPDEPWADGFEKAARDAAAELEPDEPETDATIDYRPTYLAPDAVSVVFSVSTYGHGAAHGMGRQVAFTYLPGQKRALRPSDLFQAGTTWSGFLAERGFDGLQDQAKAGNWTLALGGPGNLERTVAMPANWQIHPEGLGLYFGDVGPGEHEVLISWADLKPYLSATPAFAVPSP